MGNYYNIRTRINYYGIRVAERLPRLLLPVIDGFFFLPYFSIYFYQQFSLLFSVHANIRQRRPRPEQLVTVGEKRSAVPL